MPTLAAPVDLDAFRQARTPSLSVSVQTSSAAAATARTGNGRTRRATANAAEAAQPIQASGGVFPAISLGKLTGNAALPIANVALQFDAARAGDPVWVQTLDGGTLQAIDGQGKTITAAGGFFVDLDSAGKLSFTFQAPARSDRFQVLIRLDNIATILPFEVLEPAALESPAAVPAVTPAPAVP